MKLIHLTRGRVALVDDGDYESLIRHKWQAHWNGSNWYARRATSVAGVRMQVQMHRQILGITDPKIEVDHRDNDGLNNRRYNLRTCTHVQNMRNTPSRGNASGLRGVTYYPQRKRWVAYIKISGKQKNLGSFVSADDAAAAYNSAAFEHFGEFAFSNQPRGIPQR